MQAVLAILINHQLHRISHNIGGRLPYRLNRGHAGAESSSGIRCHGELGRLPGLNVADIGLVDLSRDGELACIG